MHCYDIHFAARPGGPRADHVRIEGAGPSQVIGWAKVHSGGRRFEIFEDGVSLGGAAFDPETEVWTLFPAAQTAAAA